LIGSSHLARNVLPMTSEVEPEKTPEWLKFEQLVANIEKTLCPLGAEVRMSEEIPDRDTGQPRQVDATIRMQVGSTSVLIGVECRKRKAASDVRWIEEVASKRKSIGAAMMIAVSDSGFTGPAKVKAAALGVQLRVIHWLTADEIRRTTDTLKLTFTHFQYRMTFTRWEFFEQKPEDALDAAFRESFSNNGWGVDVLLGMRPEVPHLKALPLVERILKDHPLDPEPEVNGGEVARQLSATFPPGTYFVPAKSGPREVISVSFLVHISRKQLVLPFTSGYRYHGEDESGELFIETAQAIVPPLPGNKNQLVVEVMKTAKPIAGAIDSGPAVKVVGVGNIPGGGASK
jgi:hypothetical protein